jgi:hypothetical protein
LQKQSISNATASPCTANKAVLCFVASPCALNKSSAFILAQVADDTSAYQIISWVSKRKSQSIS